MRPYKTICLDVETDGLDPFEGARIFGWAYMTDRGEYGWLEKTDDNLDWVRAILSDYGQSVVFFNSKFDLKMFSFEDVDVLNAKCQIEDPMIMAKCLNSTRFDYKLRTLSKEYLGRDTADKDEIELWVKANSRYYKREYGRKPNFSDAPREIVQRRALWDVESTLLLHHMLRPQVATYCPDLYDTERGLVAVTVDMELRGIRVDRTRAKRLLSSAQAGIGRIDNDLQSIACPLTIDRNGNQYTITRFNPGSSAIDLPAVFQKIGIELRYKTKPKKDKRTGERSGGGRWSFDEYAMIRYVSTPLQRVIRESGEDGWPAEKFYDEVYKVAETHNLHERELVPPLILKYRELSKMCSTYYEHLINDTVDNTEIRGNEYGILHCTFNPTKALTGRFSASAGMQTMPRLLGPRECFVPRPGHRLFFFDYAQIEMKMFVHFAEDNSMAEAIDKDIHLYIASRIYKKPEADISKEQRKRGKATGFGILYGSGAETQAETLTKKGLPTSVIEAERLINAYHREFPSVRRLTKSLKDLLIAQGYVVNPFGRRYYIPHKLGYKALNYFCQGTAADIIKRAMVRIWRYLRESSLRSRLLLTIHDELVVEIPRSEERIVVPKIVEIMEDKTTYFVPITVDVEVTSSRWSEKTNYVVKPQPRSSGRLLRNRGQGDRSSRATLPT